MSVVLRSASIDHLHSKRDSAYSSFSTSSSIPEYLASTPTFSPERSCSLEAVPQRGGDARHAPALGSGAARSRGPGPDPPAQAAAGVCYRGNRPGAPASNRHSVGPIWGPAVSCGSYESLKAAAPAPPRRSDSYAALRNHDRPNSWSSLEHARSLR